MKILQRPILATILFGLVCGISFIPLNRLFINMFFWPSAICLTLWLFTAGYALLLCRWSQRNLMSVSYPLLFLFFTVLLVQSPGVFFFQALLILSWIRSGICFQEHRGIKFGVEMILCGAGGALIAAFTPAATLAWALGTWMFFLLQAVYFAIFDNKSPTAPGQYAPGIDPFERSSRRAEDILATGGIL